MVINSKQRLAQVEMSGTLDILGRMIFNRTQGMLILLFILLSLNSYSAKSQSLQSLPMRRDCIVEVISKDTHILNFRRDDIGSTMKFSKINKIPLAGYGIQSSGTAFFQFSKNCANRLSMASIVLKKSLPKNSFLIEKNKVNPGPDTIDIGGFSWRDGNNEIIR